jgi:hypothetical protein
MLTTKMLVGGERLQVNTEGEKKVRASDTPIASCGE